MYGYELIPKEWPTQLIEPLNVGIISLDEKSPVFFELVPAVAESLRFPPLPKDSFSIDPLLFFTESNIFLVNLGLYLIAKN